MNKVNNLHKYFGDNEVLKGMSNTVAEKEEVCIIGPSGSGKSTFLRCMDLLEDVTEGTITIHGQEVTLFDGPTSALDPELVSEVGGRVIFIDGGHIVEEGEPNEMFQNPKSERLQDFVGEILV